MNSTLSKIYRKLSTELLRKIGIDPLTGIRIRPAASLIQVGSSYGGWIVPASLLTQQSICYCAGVGEDITFDLGLIEQFGCTVYAYDPTPRAADHVRKVAADNSRFHFYDIGLWDKEDTLRFYAPADPEHVSHSVLNIQKTDQYFEAPCNRLSALMKANSHQKIDLLKLDIEGAEYKTIDSIIEDRLDISVICVEYDEAHSPLDKEYKRRIKDSALNLYNYGYSLVALDQSCNYTFIKNELM